MSVVRLLDNAEMEEYGRVALDSFPAMFSDLDEEQRKGWIERMKKTQREKRDVRYYGCFREGTLVGGMRLHDFKMTLHETQTLVGGMGNMCVDLLHRKEQVAKELMVFLHRHYRELGATLTILYPFRPDFYRGMGYGYGRKMNQYKFRPSDLPRGSKEHVYYMDDSDRKLLHACFNRYAHRTHGMIEKKERYFESLLKRYKVIGIKKDGRVSGFLAFGFKKLMADHMLLHDIEVHMLVYESHEALTGLLSFLRTQLDQVNRVVLNTQDDDFHFLLHDPRNGNPKIFYTSQETNVQGLGIMYRVINTRRLFEELEVHSFNDESLRLKLNIVDTFLPENDGNLVIHFDEGKPKLADEGVFDVEVTIGVEWFSSLIMGVVDFRKLWEYGLAEASDEGYVDQLDRLFLVHRKPVTIEEF